ncbi:hypothetical protein OAS27_04940 [Alphaproteobacteria bacterium]|nr:hypothetical protein [Alphaproteobacteria bacterium]
MLISEEVNIELKVGLQNHDCYCDPYLLVQAIENIIQNAITHGGKKLRNIKIETLNDADFCKIYIDNDREMIPANPICSFFLTALAIITALLLAIPDYENKKTPDIFISDALFLIRK